MHEKTKPLQEEKNSKHTVAALSLRLKDKKKKRVNQKKKKKKQPSNTPIPPWQVRHRSVQPQERWIGVSGITGG